MRVLKALLGLALIPSAVAGVGAAAMALGQAASRPKLAWPFLAGLAGYAVFHFAVHRATALYVLGHELAHAFAAWMSGASVRGMAVGKDGGHVDLSHSNAWIALAPYVIPFYAVGAVLAYRVLAWWSPARFGPECGGTDWAHRAFLGVMGAALAFHAIHTAEALIHERQPDLRLAGGALFSLPLIALGNACVLLLAMKCLFPGAVSLHASLGAAWTWNAGFWTWAGTLARSAVAALP